MESEAGVNLRQRAEKAGREVRMPQRQPALISPKSDTVTHHYILFLHPSIQLGVTVAFREYLGGTLR